MVVEPAAPEEVDAEEVVEVPMVEADDAEEAPKPRRPTQPPPVRQAPPPPKRPTPPPPRRPTPPPVAAPAEAAPPAEPVPLPPPAVEAALESARLARTSEGVERRIAFYEAEIETLGGTATTAPDERALGALYQYEIGELLELKGDEGAAVKAYAKALAADPTLAPNLWAIRRVFEARQLWPNLLKLLDAELRFARNDLERAEIWVERGKLLEDRLAAAPDAAAQALECYEKAIVADPNNIGGWMALEKVYSKAGDLGNWARVVRGLAGATPEPARKVALLVELARGQDAIGGTLEDALTLLREAYAVGVESERVLAEVERVAESAARWDDLLWALDERATRAEKIAAESGGADRFTALDKLVGVRRRQAQVAREAGDGSRAFGFLERAAQAVPDEPLLLLDAVELAESLGRWEDLAALLARRTTMAAAGARAGLMLDRADALRQAGRAADADSVEAEVLTARPQHLGLLAARERRALHTGDWAALARLYLDEADIAAQAGDNAWTAAAATQAATLLGARLDQMPEAEAALQRALGAVPGFRPALDALERLYARAGKWAELAQLLDQELAAPLAQRENAVRERLLDSLLAIRESKLSDLAGAAEAARQLCALRPTDPTPRLRLVELLRAAGRWEDLVVELAETAKVMPAADDGDGDPSGDRRVEALVERADVLERRLADPARALVAYKDVLQIAPGERRAAEAFERLSRPAKQSADKPETSPQAWDDLAGALRREADASLSPERVVQTLLKLGEIHAEERGNAADAAKVYREILDRTPGHGAALRGLRRAAMATGDFATVAQTYETEAEGMQDASGRAAVLTLLGEVYEDRLRDDDHAEDAYERALALADAAPTANAMAATAAHAALGRLRTAIRRRDPARIGAALGRLESLAPATAPAFAEEQVWLQRLAGDLDDAAARAAKLLGDPAVPMPPVGARLQSLRLATGQGTAAVGAALEALAQQVSDPNVRGSLLLRAGLLALTSSDREAAARRLAQARVAEPGDSTVTASLAELPGVEPAVLRERAALAAGPLAVELNVAAAEAQAASGKLSDATESLRMALMEDPKHLGALELLRRVGRAGQDEDLFARATFLLATELQEAERSAALFAEAGESFEARGATREAAAAFRAVLDKTPLDGAAFNRARTLLRALDDKSALGELFAHRLASIDVPHDRVALLVERAELLYSAEDFDGAEADLRAALEIDGEQLGALERLATIVGSRAAGRAEALDLWKRHLDLVSESATRRDTLRKMAELEERSGGRAEMALQHLEAALELATSPEDGLPDRERLIAMLVRQRQWQRGIDELRRIHDQAHDGATRAAIETRIAKIYREGLRDPRLAVEALQRALKHEPLAMDTLADLVQLAQDGHLVQLDLDDKLDRALGIARIRVSDAPTEAEPYRTLVRLYAWRGDEDAGLIAQQAEALARRAEPTPRDTTIDPTKDLSASAWERIWPEVAHSVALEMWHAAGEGLVKHYGPALETLGVGKNERQNTSKGLPPRWVHVEKTGRALGCSGFELYAAKEPEVCALAGAALVVGGGFAERLPSRRRFRLAYKMTLLRERLGAFERLDAEEIAVLYAALAKVAELPAPAAARGASDAKVEERARQLGKLIGRKEKKALQALGPRLGELPAPAALRRAVLAGAARAALVVGGDLAAALAELNADLHDGGIGQELVVFANTEDFQSLRREMGLRN
jgi:tetratricopeptide (TPR) repeat protein